MKVIGIYFTAAFIVLGLLWLYGTGPVLRGVVFFLAVIHAIIASAIWAGVMIYREKNVEQGLDG